MPDKTPDHRTALLLVGSTLFSSPAGAPGWRTRLLVAALVGTLLLLGAAGQAFSATYYIAPGGTNSNSCQAAQSTASASAKATLNGATGGIACMQPGDTLVLKDGTYSEQLADVANDEHLGTTRPPAGLSWEAPTTIRAEHLGRATLTLPPGGNHVLSFGVADTRYVTVEGLVLDGTGRGVCVWIGPASPIRLRYNLIQHCGSNGIYVDVTQGVELIGNVIEHVAQEKTGPPGAHAIYFVGSHGRISGNVIRGGCPFFGIHATSEHGGLEGNVIEDNRVSGCRQAGIVSQGSNTLIRNNQLWRNGVGLQCQGSSAQRWYGNTVVGHQTSEVNPDTYGILDLTSGCDVRNNLVLEQRSTSHKSYIYATHGAPHLEGNLCDNPGERCQVLVAPGTVVVQSAARGDFRLPAGSPAIDAGVPLPEALPTDSVGRPQAPLWDVGAWAFAPPPTRPQPPDPPDPPVPPAGTPLACVGLAGSGGSLVVACQPQTRR